MLSLCWSEGWMREGGAQRGTVNNGTSVGGGYKAGTEVVVNGGDHGKGPEGLGLLKGGRGR